MELTETHPSGIANKRFKLVQLLFDTFLIFQVSFDMVLRRCLRAFCNWQATVSLC